MTSKRDLVARLSAATGLTRLLELLPNPPSLMILNYHRVGDATSCPYDTGLYSCTAQEFSEQLFFLRNRFRVVNLAQAIDIIHGRTSPTAVSVLLTFDDGYRDNYEIAFPILQFQKISATFFLPTAFIGTGLISWWDTIAYIVKTSRVDRITLSFPELMSFDLSPEHQADSIIKILKVFRRPSLKDTEHFIAGLEVACGSYRPDVTSERLFLNWDEAREMQAAGMDFGSHTHTHPILSKLTPISQLEELQNSRRIIERELGRQVLTLAYPVGAVSAFSLDTQRAAAIAGYTTAFSFYSGTNRATTTQPFDVLRAGLDGGSKDLFRLRVASLAVRGKVTV